METAKVTLGSIILFAPLSLSIGKSLSFSEKIRSNIKASKNPGMELPTKVKALIKRSINLSLLIADNIQRGIDIIKVISMALPANFIV